MQVNKPKTCKIMISAGELSGDLHAANLINSLKHIVSQNKNADNQPTQQLDIRGMGSTNLEAAGVQLLINSDKSASINGINLFKILTLGLATWFKMVWAMYRFKPDLLILVDYPDFNLRLAKIAKILRIRTFYFIPPKVWAWRQGRVKTIKKCIDHCAVIFPFEKAFFEQHGFKNVSYVGHPFADQLELKKSKLDEKLIQQQISDLGLDSNKPIVAVFVGSRQGEVERHTQIAFQTLDALHESGKYVQALFAIAPSIDMQPINNWLVSRPWAKFIANDPYKAMQLADVGLLKSGTCNLEAAFLELPFACFYTGSKTTELVVKYAVKIKEYSLVNIIKTGSIPEFIQKDATPDKLAAELTRLLDNQDYFLQQQKKLAEVVAELTSYDQSLENYNLNSAGLRAAQLALNTAKSTRSTYQIIKRVCSYLSPYKWQFIAALLCMVIFGASDGVVPFLVKYILDGVFANQDRSLLVLLPIILFVFTIIRAAADFGQQFLSARIGHNIVHDIRNQMHKHIVALTPDYFIRNSVGALLSRFTSDTLLVSALLTNSISSVIRDTIRIIALLVTAFYLDPVLALIAFVFMPIGIIPIYRFGRRMRSLSRRGQEAIGSISGLVQEAVLGNRVVKIFGREQHEIDRFAAENERLNQTFIKSERVRALTGPVNELLATLAIAGVLLYGGFSVISGVRSQGDFIAFLLSVFLLYDPFKKLTRVYSSIQQGASGAERIFDLLDVQPAVMDAQVVSNLSSGNSVDFEHVYFSYADSNGAATSQWALDDIQLHVPEGKTLALVGYSGSGKTTLVDLIPRFIQPQRGIIKIGGVDISKVALSELRARITMVSQHTFLFNDTIYNNIAYGCKNCTQEQVWEAAKAAYAHDFIIQLPNQYETIVGQDGHSLSGGERQRIAIARALLKNSPILILDEATAALDNRSENEVQLALDRLQQNRTTIVIAHRLSTIRNADCIIVLEQGKIVEAGSHQELLDQGGSFAKLYAMQFTKDSTQQSAELIN